jgi:hypothetical protein
MTKAKLSQGELVSNALVVCPTPLIDVGVNLVDHAFDKVGSAGCLLGPAQGEGGTEHRPAHTAKRSSLTAVCVTPAVANARTRLDVSHPFQDRAGVIERAKAAGVAAIVVTGCTVSSAKAARDLCEATRVCLLRRWVSRHTQHTQLCRQRGARKHSLSACATPPPKQVPVLRSLHLLSACTTQELPLFFTAGVHPHNAKDCDASTLVELRQLAAHERCVAIGGLVRVLSGSGRVCQQLGGHGRTSSHKTPCPLPPYAAAAHTQASVGWTSIATSAPQTCRSSGSAHRSSLPWSCASLCSCTAGTQGLASPPSWRRQGLVAAACRACCTASLAAARSCRSAWGWDCTSASLAG